MPRASSLYVHVPFCRAKCRYCDFYSVAFEAEAAAAYVEAAAAELRLRRAHLAVPLQTVYVGGGTPTSLGPERLQRLLSAIAGWVHEAGEFSVEANPGTIDRRLAEVLCETGVNRVTLGAQSFDIGELALLGRRHAPADTVRAVTLLRRAGIENIGLDLIYGIPDQRLATWRRSLDEALALGPTHLSCYALSFEDDTPLAADLRAGRVAEMAESLQEDCFRAAIAAAARDGLEHYEISNFARAGRRCRHNLRYWRNQPYVGIGPAAASYLGGRRWKHHPDLATYVRAVRAGQAPPSTREHLTGRAAMAETVILGLRLIRGLDRSAFCKRFGLDVLEAFGRSLGRHARTGSAIVTPSHIRISNEALFVADTILADVLAEA